jgi:WD40 repeat protein
MRKHRCVGLEKGWLKDQTLIGHDDPMMVTSVSFSRDGTLLASGSRDKKVVLWDLREPGAARQKALVGHVDGVSCVHFSSDGLTLASSSGDGLINLWSPAAAAPQRTLRAHLEGVTCSRFSPRGDILASASWDKAVHLWDVATGARIGTLDGHTLLRPCKCSRLESLDPACPVKGHIGGIHAIDFSPDGSMLATGSGDRSIIIWSVATRQFVRRLLGHADGVTSVRFSPDGLTLASGSWDRAVHFWCVSDGTLRHTLPGHNQWDSFCKCAAVGDAVGDGPGCPLAGHSHVITSIAFSPGGDLLASASADKSVVIWGAGASALPADGGWQLLHRLNAHAHPVQCVDFSRCGQYLVSAAGDSTCVLWAKAGVGLVREIQRLRRSSGGADVGLALAADAKAPCGRRCSTSEDRAWRTQRFWVRRLCNPRMLPDSILSVVLRWIVD